MCGILAILDIDPARSNAAELRRQLMCDVPYGVLISGGVDSSLIAALAARHREGRKQTVACSTTMALAWDAAFQVGADPSGRAVANVHREGHV